VGKVGRHTGSSKAATFVVGWQNNDQDLVFSCVFGDEKNIEKHPKISPYFTSFRSFKEDSTRFNS
jgi:hypothetical protein